MSTSITYKGTRWFKCDLHLHTPASKCFQDQTVTAEQWVQRAIAQGLNCVAVTDHNTGNMIDSIKVAAAGTGLSVFPGVEITCDTSKVHLLILFDTTKTTNDINDFLIGCGIRREMFAEQSASTTQTILEIAQKANEQGAIVIPAHIDEFNGLGSISDGILKMFFDLPYINAVQVVHKEFINPRLHTNNNNELRTLLNEYYNNPSKAIDYSLMAEWHKPVKIAMLKKVAITTFSDNPHEPKNPKHGLDGIGKRYTWIKMDETPTLEGLRQAFLLPDFRVKSDFVSPEIPYKEPALWIRSISIKDTTITEAEIPLKIDFSPQLTAIIGGRGSGKSSILRFIRGLFDRTKDLSELKEIITDHNEFYTHYDPRTQKGVINTNSSVEIEFVRNNVLHKITATGITNSKNQHVTIQKLDHTSGEWILEEAEGYLDFFQYEHYSQKQIYEIAQEPNSLRERIDNSILGMRDKINDREITKKTFLEKSASIRTIYQQISGKGKLQTEIKDLGDRISLFQQSGIATLLLSKEKFALQEEVLGKFLNDVEKRETDLDTLISSIALPDIDYTIFDPNHSDELEPLSKAVTDGYSSIKNELEIIKLKAERLRTDFEGSLLSSEWERENEQNKTDFETKKTELETQGEDDISNFEKLTQEKSIKEKELEKIVEIETNLSTELTERIQLKEDYLQKTKDITIKRRAFVTALMQDDKIKISINPFRNKTDFATKLRNLIQRPTGFEVDVETLTEMCFSGNVEENIKNIRGVFLKIRKGERVSEMSGYFHNLVEGMAIAQVDEIELLLPEDEIDVKYKPSGSAEFKPLSTASAGQKTTAILTFILSHGEVPLLLDQPEDDLDNRLVYELIVDRLKQAKEQRQIIVVTHNANIPVNGDAEYILSLNSETKKLAIFCAGSVEQSVVKKEICDVMEGSEQAFDMRSRRYKQIN